MKYVMTRVIHGDPAFDYFRAQFHVASNFRHVLVYYLVETFLNLTRSFI